MTNPVSRLIFSRRAIVFLIALGVASLLMSLIPSKPALALNEECRRWSTKMLTAPGPGYNAGSATTSWEDFNYYYQAFQVGSRGSTGLPLTYYRTNNGLPCAGTFDPGVGNNNDYVTFNDQNSSYLYQEGNVNVLPNQIGLGLPGTRTWEDGQPCGPAISYPLNQVLFVCQDNRQSALSDDSGRLVIDSDIDSDGSANTQTIWCIGLESGQYFTQPTPAGWQSCPPDINSSTVLNGTSPFTPNDIGYHAGAGYLFNSPGCNNHAFPQVNANCNASERLKWYLDFIPDRFLTNYIRKNIDNSLRDVAFHYDSLNSHQGGHAAYSVMTFRYPKNHAECSINLPTPLVSGTRYTVNVTMRNNGQRPWTRGRAFQPNHHFLKETGPDDWQFQQVSGGPPVNGYGSETVALPTTGPYFNNDNAVFRFSLRVPSGTSQLQIRMGQGNTEFGDVGCDRNAGSLGFTLVPSATASVDDSENENPFEAYLNANITERNGRLVRGDITTERNFYYKKSGTNPLGSSPYNLDINSVPAGSGYPFGQITVGNIQNLGLSMGDQICGTTTVTPASGTIDSSGNIISGSGSATSEESCVTIVDKPYVKFFGSDVLVGGAFEPTTPCTSSPAQINTFYDKRPTRTPAGSGVQFAALAMEQINRFPSANLEATNAASPTGLSFSNTNGVDVNTGQLGGNFGGTNCVYNFFGDSVIAESRGQNPLTIAPNRSGLFFHDKLPPTLPTQTIRQNSPLEDGQHQFIYADRNVYLSTNIAYENTDWSSAEEIPLIYIIAQGDIYINSSVTRLDGVYIAQPRTDGSGGNIYTCATLSGEFAPTRGNFIDANCRNNPLTVNGTFIAKSIKLHRTINSMRNDPNGAGGFSGSSAAELFGFSPEIYTVNICENPRVRMLCSASTANDSITSLPPIL